MMWQGNSFKYELKGSIMTNVTKGFQSDVINITPNKFNHLYFEKNIPIMLTGLSKTSAAYTKWSFQFFQEMGERFSFPVGDDLQNPTKITRKMNVGDYAKQLKESSTCPYMIGWSYQKDIPELDQDYSLPKIHPEDFISTLPKHLGFRRRWIFLGKKGNNSDIHIDCFSTSAWILMIKGQKTLRTLSPVDRHKVQMGTSLFDEEYLQKITKEGVKVIEFTLKPGTIMYIPSGWVHQIRNDDDTIMVTGGFSSETHTIRFYPNFLETVSKDVVDSEAIYLEYLKSVVKTNSFRSSETTQALQEDLQRTEKWIKQLQEKSSLYNKMLLAPEFESQDLNTVSSYE